MRDPDAESEAQILPQTEPLDLSLKKASVWEVHNILSHFAFTGFPDFSGFRLESFLEIYLVMA